MSMWVRLRHTPYNQYQLIFVKYATSKQSFGIKTVLHTEHSERKKMISIESPQITVSSRTSLLSSKLAVRDSFDEDDLSDDADDEVFIQDGRNGIKHDDERGVKRPLMPPRRKSFKTSPFQSNRHRRVLVRALWAPCCYAGLFISIFLIVIGVVVLLINSLMNPATPWTQQRATELVPPSVLVSHIVWNTSLPRIMSESNLYLHDVNNDNTKDVIFGYGTAVDRNADPGFICAMYYQSQYPCYGGVLALDGKTGQIVWQHWTEEAVFALDCSADLTGDGINDCLATGKKGLFCAINGRDGSLVWHLPVSEILVGGASEVFSPRFITDVDGDHIEDVVASHTGASTVCGHTGNSPDVQGHLLVLSGATGQIMQCVPTPNHIESFTTPQLLIWPDGLSVLLVGTGGPHTPGGLFAMPMHPMNGVQLARSRMLYQSKKKGGMLIPSLLVDITGDGTQDIVAAMFDSIVIAFDGLMFKPLWNFSIPSSELHSPICAGYYNEDDIPDILIRFHLGPGFPSYHYSQTQILDGRTGKPLLDKPLSGAPSSDNAPGLSLEGHGNDAFLVWASGCLAHEAAVGGPLPPSAREGTAADWDRCDPKFNSTSSDLKLITKHVPPPGIHIFHTEETSLSQQAKLKDDYTAATSYIEKHSDFWDEYSTLLCSSEETNLNTAPVVPQQPDRNYPAEPRGEQNEDIYLSMPHQVRKHGNKPPPQPPASAPRHQFSQYQDYDTEFMRPQQQEINPNTAFSEVYRRTGRQVESTNHKILSSHLSSGVVAPRLEITAEGVDLIFTSHWSVSRDAVLPAFQQCLATELAQHRTNRQRFMVSCKRQAQAFAKSCWSEAIQLGDNPARPFGASRMAYMVVHRISLQLQCQLGKEAPKQGQRCAGILPWGLQSLSASPGTTLFHTRSAGVKQ